MNKGRYEKKFQEKIVRFSILYKKGPYNFFRKIDISAANRCQSLLAHTIAIDIHTNVVIFNSVLWLKYQIYGKSVQTFL